MQYGHIYVAICIIIKLKVMFWKLYTRIYFNVVTFKPNWAGYYIMYIVKIFILSLWFVFTCHYTMQYNTQASI